MEKTAAKLESFELFHCDVGVGSDHISVLLA
jgi:hypothetical protein